MEGARSQFVDAIPDLVSKRLDAWCAEHVSAREDVLRDFPHAAEACCVAQELGWPVELREEALHLPSVKPRGQVPLLFIGPKLVEPCLEPGKVGIDFMHPVAEEVGGELRDVKPFRKDLARAGLVAFFMRALHVATCFPCPLITTTEPLLAEVVECLLDRGQESGPEECRVFTWGC